MREEQFYTQSDGFGGGNFGPDDEKKHVSAMFGNQSRGFHIARSLFPRPVGNLENLIPLFNEREKTLNRQVRNSGTQQLILSYYANTLVWLLGLALIFAVSLAAANADFMQWTQIKLFLHNSEFSRIAPLLYKWLPLGLQLLLCIPLLIFECNPNRTISARQATIRMAWASLCIFVPYAVFTFVMFLCYKA